MIHILKPTESAGDPILWEDGSMGTNRYSPEVRERAMLIAENQSPSHIADRLGHESTRTVLDVYGHLDSLDRLRIGSGSP